VFPVTAAFSQGVIRSHQRQFPRIKSYHTWWSLRAHGTTKVKERSEERVETKSSSRLFNGEKTKVHSKARRLEWASDNLRSNRYVGTLFTSLCLLSITSCESSDGERRPGPMQGLTRYDYQPQDQGNYPGFGRQCGRGRGHMTLQNLRARCRGNFRG